MLFILHFKVFVAHQHTKFLYSFLYFCILNWFFFIFNTFPDIDTAISYSIWLFSITRAPDVYIFWNMNKIDRMKYVNWYSLLKKKKKTNWMVCCADMWAKPRIDGNLHTVGRPNVLSLSNMYSSSLYLTSLYVHYLPDMHWAVLATSRALHLRPAASTNKKKRTFRASLFSLLLFIWIFRL